MAEFNIEYNRDDETNEYIVLPVPRDTIESILIDMVFQEV